METEKLYYQDAYLTTFTGTVQSCDPVIDAFRIALDRTAFYPEGGGQPADHGILRTPTGETVQVTDVHEKDGTVCHYCAAPIAPGTPITGEIDWPRRFDHMQQHSGEHIISGILCDLYHCDNVGFHLGADTVTIDYNAEITWEQALEAEQRANETVWADQPVSIAYPTPEELANLNYRSKKALTGQVRIVTFPDADCCACCGTHTARAGQVGIIKIISCQKFRDGVRIEILCGNRALQYLSAIHEQNRAVSQRLSAKPHETMAAVERLEQELAAAKRLIADLEKTAFAAIAAEQTDKGDVFLFHPPMKPDSVRRLTDAIAKTCNGLAAVFAGEDQTWSYALVHSNAEDITPLVKSLNQTLYGRGGGRNGFAQGSVKATKEEIELFFTTTKNQVERT